MIPKRLSILFTIFIIIFLPIHQLSAETNIIVDDSFIYDIEQASAYHRYILHTSSTNLYRVTDIASVDVGSELNITVSEITASTVKYIAYENTMQLADYTITSSMFNLTLIFDNIFAMFSLDLVSSGQDIVWTNGINFADSIYFIPNDLVLQDLYDIYDGSIWNEAVLTSQYNTSSDFFLGTTAAWINGGNTLSLESMQDGMLYNETTNTYIDVLYDNRVDYEATGRYLQGSYTKINMTGILEGGNFEFEVDIRLVKQGYTGLDIVIIDEFKFNIELILISIILFNIIIKRKKRRL